MKFCIPADQLRAALDQIETAEANGFHHSLATFVIVSIGPMIKDTQAEFLDLWDRGHPTDLSQDWGREGTSRRFRLVNGELITLQP
jgi:nitrate reductase assembly molybdenum cofactor insertion protein NarJ